MAKRKSFRVELPSGSLVLGSRTLIMGVLNVTPDSFSDGGKYLSPDSAVRHALKLQDEGADLLDIGAESTRPGSLGIPAAEQLRLLLPVLEALRSRLKIPISVDTQQSSVAEIAIGAGAQLINDVSGLRHDPRIAKVAAHHRVPLILVHMRGMPRTMQRLPFAKNAVKEVTSGLRRSVRLAQKAGVAKHHIILDPGIGFGKSFAQNYELLAHLGDLAKLGYPILVGTSRKGFLGATLAKTGTRPRREQFTPAEGRLLSTAASVAASILNGAHIVRVHDVLEMAEVASVADQCLSAR